MTVAVVWVEGDVGDDGELGKFFLEPLNGARDEAYGIGTLDGLRGFEQAVDGGKEDNGIDAEGMGGGGFADEAVEAQARASGHGGNRFIAVALLDKKGINELFGPERGLPDQSANGGGLPVAAEAVGEGKGGIIHE